MKIPTKSLRDDQLNSPNENFGRVLYQGLLPIQRKTVDKTHFLKKKRVKSVELKNFWYFWYF